MDQPRVFGEWLRVEFVGVGPHPRAVRASRGLRGRWGQPVHGRRGVHRHGAGAGRRPRVDRGRRAARPHGEHLVDRGWRRRGAAVAGAGLRGALFQGRSLRLGRLAAMVRLHGAHHGRLRQLQPGALRDRVGARVARPVRGPVQERIGAAQQLVPGRLRRRSLRAHDGQRRFDGLRLGVVAGSRRGERRVRSRDGGGLGARRDDGLRRIVRGLGRRGAARPLGSGRPAPRERGRTAPARRRRRHERGRGPPRRARRDGDAAGHQLRAARGGQCVGGGGLGFRCRRVHGGRVDRRGGGYAPPRARVGPAARAALRG